MIENNQSKEITTFKENYLKALLEMSNDNGIHSIEIAKKLCFSKASVSRMMRILKNDGYIIKENYGTIALTETGIKIATLVKQRNELIKSFLIEVLGVEDSVAKYDACRMEHNISIETIQKLDKQLKKLSNCAKCN